MDTTPTDIRQRAAAAGLSVREERLDEVARVMAANLAALRGAFRPNALDGVPDDFRAIIARNG